MLKKLFCIFFVFSKNVFSVDNQNSPNLQEFASRLVQFINQETGRVVYDPKHDTNIRITNSLGSEENEESVQEDYETGGYPNGPYQPAQRPFPPGQQPFPPGQQPFPPVQRPFPPGQRPFPPGQQPFPPLYPSNSFLNAMSSIARYDDLRCVPRLLCELTTGRGSGKDSHKSPTPSTSPILSRDSLVSMLTILNFVDDSPLLLFARATLLGYSSKGNPNVCLNAYPTCPRNPDQLVNYLNNHNGGFFKFFNQQLQQQLPQYQIPQFGPQVKKSKKPKTLYNTKKQISPRILSAPINVKPAFESQNYEEVYPVPILTSNRYSKKIKFRDTLDSPNYQQTLNSVSNFVFPRETQLNLQPQRPGRYLNSNRMIFPDRTGTGNLILSSDNSGAHYASEEKYVKFNRKLKFPSEEEENRESYY